MVHLGYDRGEVGKKPSLELGQFWALHGVGLRAPGRLGLRLGRLRIATGGHLPDGPCGGLLCRGRALGCRGLGITLSPQEPTRKGTRAPRALCSRYLEG